MLVYAGHLSMKSVGGVDFFLSLTIIAYCLTTFFSGYLCIYFHLSIYLVLSSDTFLCISMVSTIAGVPGKAKDACKSGTGDDALIGAKGGA